MQGVMKARGDLEALIERIGRNRSDLSMSIVNLDDARIAAQERRNRRRILLGEARQSLETLRHQRALLDRSRSVGKPSLPPRSPFAKPDANPVDTDRQRLHKLYAATRDTAVRDQLMASYDGFARSLALKFRSRDAVDDLVQVARIALLHAVDRFDPSLGRPFPLFARITITGELKRHIRDHTWGMRVPRSLQEDYLSVMRAVDDLTAEESRSPSMGAVAARCGLPVERVVEAMELRVTQRALSIDAPANSPDSDEPTIELRTDEVGFGHFENSELLQALLARLPERDRRIVELRFVDELTQSEIAARVGVSQMCVSRVLARTLGRLRAWARTAMAS
jgi:RNA polymerase sigma-B factor